MTSRKANHYVIIGEWGIGKTSLFSYFKTMALQQGYIAALFSLRHFSKADSHMMFTQHIIQSILRDIPIPRNRFEDFKSQIQGLGINVLGSGLQIQFSSDSIANQDPQVLLAQSLETLWSNLSKEYEAAVVLLDDVQNLHEKPQALTMLKNVLSDAHLMKSSRVLFVLNSTPEGWKHFLDRNNPIGRYFIPRRSIERLSKDDTFALVSKTLGNTGVSFQDEIYENIWDYAEGHPFEIQCLGEALYNLGKSGKVGIGEWDRALHSSLLVLGDAVFESWVSKASKRELIILGGLSQFARNAYVAEIKTLTDIRAIGNINEYLRRLVEKGLIVNPSRGEYMIKDALFRKYVREMS